MGLTIHYEMKSKAVSALQSVRQMRQLALDLPFEEVGDIVDIRGSKCDFESRREELQNNDGLFWLLIQAQQSVKCPWNRWISSRVTPTRIIAFNTWPGHGSEAANFGLCEYPSEINMDYSPKDDERFQPDIKKGFSRFDFSYCKWERHRKRHGSNMTSICEEARKVPTNLDGWYWSSFCKTQYASDPECGGVPNFLRCHISVITLLDRIAKLPDVHIRVDDEGKYGPGTYSDDWKEAREAGRDPTYRRHKGRYSPVALANEVGEWNEMIAGFSGAMSDALVGSGLQLEAPIKGFANFEQLEFRGQNLKYLDPFLKAMKSLATEGSEHVV